MRSSVTVQGECQESVVVVVSLRVLMESPTMSMDDLVSTVSSETGVPGDRVFAILGSVRVRHPLPACFTNRLNT